MAKAKNKPSNTNLSNAPVAVVSQSPADALTPKGVLTTNAPEGVFIEADPIVQPDALPSVADATSAPEATSGEPPALVASGVAITPDAVAAEEAARATEDEERKLKPSKHITFSGAPGTTVFLHAGLGYGGEKFITFNQFTGLYVAEPDEVNAIRRYIAEFSQSVTEVKS